jgi:hypothetical protein
VLRIIMRRKKMLGGCGLTAEIPLQHGVMLSDRRDILTLGLCE